MDKSHSGPVLRAFMGLFCVFGCILCPGCVSDIVTGEIQEAFWVDTLGDSER